MYRTKTCGELRAANIGETVVLSGWVQKSRELGGMTFVDLRDRYGITQLVFDENQNAALCEEAKKLGREFVIQIEGKVVERSSKNPKMDTGDIEISKIAAGQDVAVITRRDKAFGITDLAVDLSGDDPMGWIASRLGAYWARRDNVKIIQEALITLSNGVWKGYNQFWERYYSWDK